MPKGEAMIHIRIDNEELNRNRRFACGIGPDLPEGDVYYFASELGADRADCPACNPRGPKQIGTLASAMNGNAARRHEDPDAWNRWVAFCDANGHP